MVVIIEHIELWPQKHIQPATIGNVLIYYAGTKGIMECLANNQIYTDPPGGGVPSCGQLGSLDEATVSSTALSATGMVRYMVNKYRLCYSM